MYEYLMLTTEDRADLLWQEGVFLANFGDDHTKVNLYSLGDFYVEVLLDRETDAIIEVVPFRGGIRMEKYLNRIQISDLL